MKRNWLLVIPGVVILAGIVMAVVFITGRGNPSSAGQKTSRAEPQAVPAPGFSEKDIFGTSTVTLSNYVGQVVLLNFWATWCPPCRAEIPDLVALHNKYKGRFTVIGISLDQEGPRVVRPFVRENKISYPVIMGTAEMVQNYGGITAIPTSYLINKKGEAVAQIVGYRSGDQYEAMILKYLEEISWAAFGSAQAA